MDAIGVAGFAVGGFLLYASIKGEHPWQLFTSTLGAASPTPTIQPGAPAQPGQSGYGASLVPVNTQGVAQ